MPSRLTKLRVTFRTAGFAELALTITLFQFSLAILLLVFGIFLTNFGGSGAAHFVCGGLWILSLGMAIFMTGPRKKKPDDMKLGTFHILPVAMLLAAIPTMIGNLDHLSYMMGFVDFIIFMAMLAFGLICLRNLRWPSLGFWVYLALGFLVLNRLR